MHFSELETKIEHLIAIDDMESAIALLLLHFQDQTQLEELIILSGIYHSLRKDMHKGIVAYEEVQRVLNQLRISILEFTKRAAALPLQQPQTITESYFLSLARLTILWLLQPSAAETPAFSLSEIHQQSGIKSRKYIANTIYEMEQYDLVEKFKAENITYWKLAEKGVELLQEMKSSLIFKKESD